MRPFLLPGFAVLLGVSACAVGPDYQGPPQTAPAEQTAPAFHRASSATAENGPPAALWWQALNDPELDALITTAFANSPSLHAAEARLREARATLSNQRANELPSASGTALYLHTQLPGGLTGGGAGNSASGGSQGASGAGASGSAGSSNALNFYDVGFDATWELDIFGGTRRAIEATAAQAQASQADLEDLHVSLAAEIAQAYVGLRDEQQRLALARQSAALEQQMLTLTEQRRAGGTAAEVDVERLRTQFETTQGTTIPLRGQIEGSLDQLAVLTGREPGALDQELSDPKPLPALPTTVAVGDPAAMLRRRPDIRKAERMLAASNAQIGQQVANYFPKVSLLGDVGWGSTAVSHLFASGNFTPVIAPILQWNVLDFGRTRAKIREAQAGRDEAAANYEATVLSALEDAETALSRYGRQRENVVSLERIQASADRTLALTRQRYTAGAASLLDLLDAERTRFSAEQNLAAGRAQVVTDYASLQKSLGLGWAADSSSRQDPPPS